MNGVDEEQMGPQTFLYGCELKAGKDVIFNPDDDDFEHQLDLRMVCMDATTKDELHVVEVEGQDMEGQKVKAVLASLKPSTLPSVCIGGFAITPPAVFRLKAGSGPIHISGQHLVMMGGDQSFDEEEEEEEEDEDVQTPKKRPALTPGPKSKKMKMDGDDDDDEEEDDEDDEEDDDDEEESEGEESPIKVAEASPAIPKLKKKSPAKPTAQNGGTPKAKTTPAKPKVKSPDAGKARTPKTPKPPSTLTIPELKEKMMTTMSKGVKLPTLQPKFENFIKNGLNVHDAKIIQELWTWRQTVKDEK